MRQNNIGSKQRELKALAEKLQRLIMHPRVEATIQVEKLIQKIKILVNELAEVLSHAVLKKILGAAAIFIGISFPSKSDAQLFASPVQNPFGLVATNYVAFPAFADLDNDGDTDLLVGEYYGVLKYFQNIGSEFNPEFAAPQFNPFGLIPNLSFALPAFADLDADGDIDLLVGEYYGTFKYFENTGTPTDPQFAEPQLNPFGLVPTLVIAIPTFADIDGDGDQDLLVGEGFGGMQYFQNTGSISNPQFDAPVVNPFGLDSTYNLAFPAFADLDMDGDLDLLVGENYGGMQYFHNNGTILNPQFAAPQFNPFGLVSTYYNSFPAFADLDGDGDMDLLVGEYYGAMQYFENITVGVEEFSPTFDLNLYPNPVSNTLKIESDENIDRIEIFNSLGKNVITINDQASEISLHDLTPGTYLVKVTSDKGYFTTRKIHKQ